MAKHRGGSSGVRRQLGLTKMLLHSTREGNRALHEQLRKAKDRCEELEEQLAYEARLRRAIDTKNRQLVARNRELVLMLHIQENGRPSIGDSKPAPASSKVPTSS